MTESTFWKIIDTACGADPDAADEWKSRLVDHLAELPANEIVECGQICDRLIAAAYRADLWAAAYIINDGASDDTFYYFRCWLIGMGKQVYEAAVANPDCLADVVDGSFATASIGSAAMSAWAKASGRPESEFPNYAVTEVFVGEFWDFDDEELMRDRLPRLAAMYYDSE